jgi:hypothetical protein
MKPVLRSAILTGVLALGAASLFGASDSYIDQWYRAKLGRSSPMEEARLKAERANTAYREEATPKALAPANTFIENFHKAKLGRCPIEEARLKAERANTAYREEVTPKAPAPANTWREDFWKAKYGRSFPVENTDAK